MSDPENKTVDPISGLTTEIAELRDLFVRRLMDDKVKNNAIEKLSAANRELIRVVEEKQIDSMSRELILLCDRIYQQPSDDAFAWSVLDEILEIMARRGIEQISQLDVFDPHLHNAVSTVPATDEAPPGTIVQVLRSGYQRGQTLLRAADVIISK